MSQKSRYIKTNFWSDEYVINLDPSEKLIFLYLLTSPKNNLSGIYKISYRIMAFEVGMDEYTVKNVLKRFDHDGKVMLFDDWVAIKNNIKNQNYKSPKIQLGINRELTENEPPQELIDFIKIPKELNIEQQNIDVANVTNVKDKNKEKIFVKENSCDTVRLSNGRKKERKPKQLLKQLEIPEEINKISWLEWEEYRKDIKKKLTDRSRKLQQKMLLEYNKAQQKEIINDSIRNGWTGLFKPKQNNSRNNITYKKVKIY